MEIVRVVLENSKTVLYTDQIMGENVARYLFLTYL